MSHWPVGRTGRSVWAAAWYYYLKPDGGVSAFLCSGFFLTGVVLLIIGFTIGLRSRPTKFREEHIGRDSDHPEVAIENDQGHVSARPTTPAEPH